MLLLGMSRFSLPSLNWLRVFEAAARHENFARASQELAVSPAAVSQQILALETYLGEPLFVRTANRIELNSAGRSLLPTVEHSLSNIEAKLSSLFANKPHQHVVVEASNLLAMSWLPSKIALFEREHPNTKILVRTEDSFRPEIDEPAEVTIRFGKSSEFRSTARELINVTYRVVGSADVIRRIRRIEDLKQYQLFDVASHSLGWQHLLSRMGATEKATAWNIVAVENTPIAFMMAREGLGLAISLGEVCKPLVSTLGLEHCAFIPEVGEDRQYFMELQSTEKVSRGAIQLERWLTNHVHGDGQTK